MDASTKESLIPHFAPFKEVPQSSSGSLQDSRRQGITDRIEFNPPLSPLLPLGLQSEPPAYRWCLPQRMMIGRKRVNGGGGRRRWWQGWWWWWWCMQTWRWLRLTYNAVLWVALHPVAERDVPLRYQTACSLPACLYHQRANLPSPCGAVSLTPGSGGSSDGSSSALLKLRQMWEYQKVDVVVVFGPAVESVENQLQRSLKEMHSYELQRQIKTSQFIAIFQICKQNLQQNKFLFCFYILWYLMYSLGFARIHRYKPVWSPSEFVSQIFVNITQEGKFRSKFQKYIHQDMEDMEDMVAQWFVCSVPGSGAFLGVCMFSLSLCGFSSLLSQSQSHN